MGFLTLEALAARHGDCLLLHYGTAAAPKLLLVDGGPSGVYGNALRPRLQQLRPRYEKDGVFQVAIAMVSHIDDDHIQGLNDLTAELVEADEQGVTPWLRATTLWHNSFEDLAGTTATPSSLALPDTESVTASLRAPAAVIASVGQGRQLRNDSERLDWPRNKPFPDLVVAPAAGGASVTLDAQTRLTVVGPSQARVDALQKEWQEQLRRLARADADPASVAAYIDRSVYNLSSIVCLVEAGRETILLTGDARGDDIVAGLTAAGLLNGGELEVSVLKLPHHGSDRNVETDFFRTVKARHYVISGDGRHGNPEMATLQMLLDARADDDFTLHFTYQTGRDGLTAKLEEFLEQQRRAGRTFKVQFRDENALSLRIDLLDPIGV